jgi:hypothetical protein
LITWIAIPEETVQLFESHGWTALSAMKTPDVAVGVTVAVRNAEDGSTRVASGRSLLAALDALASVVGLPLTE